MKYSNTVEYNISTKLDSKGLTQLKSELQAVELSLQKMGNKDLLNKSSFSEARVQIQNLRESLSKAFDPSLGILDLSKLNVELKESGITASSLKSAFTQAGAEGQVAFNNLVKELGQVDTGIQRSNSSLDKMFTTFSNTFRWGLVSSFFSQFMNAIHQSVDYVKELDDSLTQIMLVTDYNRDAMNEYAKSANEAAKAVSMTTTGMTNASLIFAQQGYGLEQSQELATLSAKLANASQQDTATTSDQITAYMNAYGLQDSMEELTQQMDNWALIANVSAADVSELAQASQRAASMANAVGVSGEALAAQIATIESVTREAPEQIGNGLKTLYARFSDISLGGEDEDGVGLGKVTSTLEGIGVKVLDQFGNIRQMDDIMEDLMVVWDDLDQTSKIAASQALAGKYQVNRFMALMDNSEMYQEYKGATGTAAAGTLDQMNEEYADSLAGRSAKLQATLEGIFSNIFNTDSFYPFLDVAQKTLDVIDNLTEAMGGGIPIITALTSAFLNLFSKNIAQQINDSALNAAVQKQRAENFQNKEAALSQLGLANPNPENQNSQNILNYAQQLNKLAPNLSNEQLAQGNQILGDMVHNANEATKAEAELNTQLTALGTTVKTIFGKDANSLIPFMDNGAINASEILDFLKQTEKFDLKDIFEGSQEKVEGTVGELQNFSTALQLLRDEARKTEDEERNLDEAFQLGVESLQALKTAMGKEDLTILENAFNDFYQKLKTGNDDINETGNEIDALTVDIGELIKALIKMNGIQLSPEQLEQMIEKVENLNFKAKNAGNGAIDSNKVGNAFIDSAETQKAVQQIINLTSALGQLASAISMIRSLGSIINNEDLAPTEKFTQILSNLTMLIPTVLIGLNNLRKAWKELKDMQILHNAVETISQALTLKNIVAKQTETGIIYLNAAAEKEAAKAAVAAAAAETGATAASQSLALALMSLNPVVLAVGAALAILAGITLKNFWDEAKEAEAQKAALQAIADETTNTVQQINQTRDSFNDLWDQYKITGEASDQFKNALKEQCEILGVTDGELLIVQGKYDELKTKIDAATESVYANNTALLAANLKNKDQNPADQLTKAQQEKIGITTHIETEVREGTGTDTGTTSTWSKEVYDQSAYQQVKAAQNYIKQSQEEINNLTKERIQAAKDGDAIEIERIDQQLGILAQDITAYQDFVNANKDIISTQEQIRDNQLDMELADPKSIFKNGSYDEIKDFIQEIGGETVDSSNIDELIAKYAELAGNADIAAEAAEKLKENVEKTPDNLSFTSPENNYRSDEQQKNIQEDLNISDEEYIGYQNILVDENEHLEALSKEAKYLEENNEVLQQHRRELQQETKDLQDEKAALEEKAENLKNNESQYIKLQKQIKDYSKQIEKNQKELKKEVKTSEDVQDQLEDLENKIIETAVGAKELGEVWEDNSAILRNSESNWAQQADAINNLAPGLAHLLNIDLSEIQTLPQSFWESTQNLDDMEAAINGDVEALQRLRGEVAQELLVKAGVDPNSDLYGEMVELINMANTILPQLEAGATLDDSQFIAKLNEMIATTIAAGGNIEAVLATYERLGLQFTQTGTTQMQIPHVTMRTSGSPVKQGAGGLIETAVATGLEMIPSVSWETVEVPTYDYKKTSGGAGFNGGYTPKTPGRGGGSCFVAGTQISTISGFKNIEDIKPGNIVLSYNTQKYINQYSVVLQTMIHDTTEKIYTLYIKNEQLRVTGIHRFYIKQDLFSEPEWITAENLHIGNWVLLAEGTWHLIWKIEVAIETQTVYNFEVCNNHNYYVGRNQILAHNKGGNKGKSPKKSGGSGKKKEIKTKEKREHEKDYYEEVNSQLDKTEKILSKIEKEEDRLIGDKARANQNKQLELLQKEIKLNEKKLKIQKQELKDIDALIKKEDKRAEKAAANVGVKTNIPNIKLDKDGIVSNYEEISKAVDKTYNELIKKYNEAAKKGDEKLAEKIEKNIDKFDDYSKNLLEQIKRHNKLQGEIVDTEDALESLSDAIEDIRIDAYKASQEAIDNLKDIKESAAELDKLFRDFDNNSFMNKFSIDNTPYGDLIEDLSKLDNIYSVTQKDANKFYQDLIDQKKKALKETKDEDEKKAIQNSIDFFTQQQAALQNGVSLENGLLGLAQQDLARLQGWIDNPKAADNVFGNNTNALFEAYQDAYDRVLNYTKEYRELIQDTRDSILDIYNNAEDAIERQADQYDRLIDKVEQISDTYSLYYGEDSYAELDKFYAQQGQIMQNQLNQLTSAYQYWEIEYQKVLTTGDEKLIQEIEDKMNSAEDAMLDKAKELAELWVEKFENVVQANTQFIYNKLFNGQDFDDLSANWELQKDYMERYKDEVEKSYELDKLRSKYLDLLNDAQGSSLQTQNKIRQQMQEQLNYLQDQASISEYDVKLANAKLEILQKQIALEDAQRNKNQMQLRRDSQGNYRYTYRANQKDVKAAQDELLDSQYNAYELTKNETVSNNDRALNLLQDFLSKRADIFNKYKDDDEAREKALEELSNNYTLLLQGMEEDFADTTNGMYDILSFMVKNGTEDTTNSAIDMLNNLFDEEGKFKEDTEVLWADLANTVTDMLENFEDTVKEANNEIISEVNLLKEKMTGDKGVLTKIGSSSNEAAEALDKVSEATNNLTSATEQLFESFGADNEKMQKALDKLAEYETQLRSTQNTTSNLAQQLNQANQTISSKNAQAQNFQTIIDIKTGVQDFKKGEIYTLKKGAYVSYHRDGKSQIDEKNKTGFKLEKDMKVKIYEVGEKPTNGNPVKYGIRIFEAGKTPHEETYVPKNQKIQAWHINEDTARQYLSYDTGGYTGDWKDQTNNDKNGKLAVLHQKELVLNATDTENVLTAVKIMREITSAFKNSSAYMSAIKNTSKMGTNDTIQQRVEISASFPNASSITDIEQALIGLSDQAYQYAHRNI